MLVGLDGDFLLADSRVSLLFSRLPRTRLQTIDFFLSSNLVPLHF